MHFENGFCYGISQRAETKSSLRYPRRRTPNHAVFAAIYQRLGETGLFGTVYEMDEDYRSTTVEEYVVDRMKEDPNVSSSMHTHERSWNLTN